MDAGSLFLKFWDQEAKATRNVIARIPEGSTYRPDPKSRTAREIAWVLILKFLLLWMIWWAFFSDPPARPMQIDLSQAEQRLLITAFPAEPVHAKR